MRQLTIVLYAAAAYAFPSAANEEPPYEVFEEKSQWEAAVEAVGSYETIDFTCCGPVQLNTQYADLGVHFTANDNFMIGPGRINFPNDEWGAKGLGLTIPFEFDEPQRWLATDFPGLLVYNLYLNDELIHEPIDAPVLGGSGNGWFGGVVSSVPFNRVVLIDWAGTPVVDDLHFGGPEPADTNGDGIVDVDDLIEVILNWGVCTELYCSGDTDVDGIVDTSDLVTIILGWQ